MQQGIILAGGAVIAIVGQFLFGYLCDRFHRIRRFFLIGYVIFLAAAVAMLLHEETLFTYHLFAIALSAGNVSYTHLPSAAALSDRCIDQKTPG